MIKLPVLVFLFLFVLPGFAQKSWYFNLTPGTDVVFPSPLSIKQSGNEKISLWAFYRSEPFKLPVYYSCRVGFCNGQKGWEAETNHLKIFLKNKPPEVGHFSISHGYNQVFINRVVRKGKLGIKLGAGFVLAHPENTVRGLTLDGNRGLFGQGYYIAGPAVQYGFYEEIGLTKWFYILLESKISVAYANVPVANGRAHVPVAAFHLQAGPGFRIFQK